MAPPFGDQAMDFAARRVFAAGMSTPSKRGLSKLSRVCGIFFLVSGLSTPIFESELLFTICLLSVPVLVIVLVIDLFHRRFWAVVPLVTVVAALTWLMLALRSFDIPVGG